MITTRFAPSPTGYLHIGGLRTALFSYLHAKRSGGKCILRIEDTDTKRNNDDAVKAILEAFEWVGLKFDGEITYQSKRTEIYKQYIQKLLDENKAYYCYMSKDELDELRASAQAQGKTPRYDGRYRDGKLPPRSDVSPVVRIKAPQGGEIVIDDGVKGKTRFNWIDATDDFIIARSDGTPTFNFCVAIDDALMGVTHVIRGDDHLSNTPKQIVVYEALGLNVPKFFHIPMIHNEKGKKLSKRDGATNVMEYKALGFLPQALLNFLVRLGWSNKDQEIFSFDEMLALFDANKINKSASAYNLEKLYWLNKHYIKSSSNDELKKHLQAIGISVQNDLALSALKEKSRTLIELADELAKFERAPNYKDVPNDEEKEILKTFSAVIERLDFSSESAIEQAISEFLTSYNIKMPQLGKPLRKAFFGEPKGLGIAQSLQILQKDEAILRIKNYIKWAFF